MNFPTIHLVPYETVARSMGISRFVVAAIERRALRRVRAALSAMGFDGSEIPYVYHALGGYPTEDTPADRRRARDRDRYWRRKREQQRKAK